MGRAQILKNALISRLEKEVADPKIMLVEEIEDYIYHIAKFSSHEDFVNFDKQTKFNQNDVKLGVKGLQEIYSRRLLAGFYFEYVINKNYKGIVIDATKTYDRAGSAAAHLSLETNQKIWNYMSAVVRTISFKISKNKDKLSDAFYSAVFGSEQLLKLLEKFEENKTFGFTKDKLKENYEILKNEAIKLFPYSTSHSSHVLTTFNSLR